MASTPEAPQERHAPEAWRAIPAASARFERAARRVGLTRSRAAALLALLGFGLMIAAALDLRTANLGLFLLPGSLKMLLGGLAIGAAIHTSDTLPALGKPLAVPLGRLRRSWWVFAGAGTLLLVLLAEINGGMLHVQALAQVSSRLQFAMFFAGIALVGYGFGGAPSLSSSSIWRWLRNLKIDWSIVIPLGAIIGLALFLRLWNIAGTVRYLIDELHWSDAILAVESRPYLKILTPMSGESPYSWIFPYWQSAAVYVFGHTLVGLRFVSAITGTLTVLAAFGLARELFDRKTALLAALILATFPPHVHFSRIAMTLIADPLFGTLALMFIVRALRNNRPMEWALGGVALGMTQYFYEGGRLLFPPLILGFVLLLALRGQMRGKGRGFVILVVTAVIVGAPFYYTLIANGKPLFGRYDVSGLGTSYWHQLAADGISLNDISVFVQHSLSGFAMYGAGVDTSVYFGSNQALVLDFLLPFFLFGAFYLAWRYPAPAFLVPFWIVATALGNGLLRDTMVTARYYVVLPALALAIAAGVRYLLAFFWLTPEPDAAGVSARQRRLGWALPAVAVGAIAAVQVGYYFGPYLPAYNVQVRNAKVYRDGLDAVQRAVDLPGNTQIFIVGKPVHDQNVTRNFLGFLSRDGDPGRYFPLKTVPPDTISPRYLLDLTPGVNYAFFIEPTDVDAIAQLERYFPGISVPQYTPWDIAANKEYLLFYVPSDFIPPRHMIKHKGTP